MRSDYKAVAALTVPTIDMFLCTAVCWWVGHTNSGWGCLSLTGPVSSMGRVWVWLPLFLLSLSTTLSSANQNELTVAASPCDSQSPDQLVLDAALQMVGSDDTVYLESGEHCIRNFSLVSGLRNISLVGESSSATTVRCMEGLGIAFVNISSLSIRNLTIDGCGLTGQPLGESVNRLTQFSDLFVQTPIESTIAVVIGQVENLWMEKVTIRNTNGLGLIGVNVIGNSSLTEVHFSNNIRQATCLFLNTTDAIGALENDPRQIGGGAFFIYYDYVSGREPIPLPKVVFDRVTFVENSECTYSLVLYSTYSDSRTVQRQGYVIGGGGGLTLILAQLNYGVDFQVKSSLFRNNTARYGSGATIGIFTGVRDSYIQFNNCSFVLNGNTYEEVMADLFGSFATGGGGMLIAQELYRPGLTEQPSAGPNRNLLMEISDSFFITNGARIGGGVIFYSLEAAGISGLADTARLLFDNCTFEYNMAPIGAAMWLTDRKLNGRLNLGPLVELRDVRLERNIARPVNFTIATAQDNAAVADIRGLNITISGTSYFTDNLGTGLQASGSLVGISANAIVYFERNSGVFGGAMTMLFYSYLILERNSSLYLRENVAKSQGGAFYVNLIGSNSASFFDDCFLYFSYNDFSVCDEQCADLNSTGVYVELVGNAAVYGGSTSYGSSLQFCPWAVQLRLQGYDDGTAFQTLNRYFPSRFNFSQQPNTSELVTTLPRQLVIHNPQPSYSVVPGSLFSLNLSTTDGLGYTIRSIISTYVLTIDGQSNVEEIQSTASFFSTGFGFLREEPTVLGAGLRSTENRTISLILYSLDCLAIAQQEIVVQVGFCPSSGFVFNSTIRSCECDQRLLDKGITCSLTELTLTIPDDLWYGPLSDGSDELVAYECLDIYCEPGIRSISVQEEPIDYDVQCTNDSNRGGLLCGTCREGYSIVLGSERCLRCNNGYAALILLFLALGILLVVMISYLQITLTAGYLNGVLFYANIVSLYGPELVPARPFDGRLAFSSFLSLSLGIETCFHDGMTALEKVWWQLSFPLYLVFLMFVIIVLARCFKWRQRAGFATIQGMATLSIFCYVSVLETCVELLGFVSVETLSGKHELRWGTDPTVAYFNGVHGLLAFIAICLVIFYILPLPLLLLFPQLLYRLRFFRNLKPFYDALFNPFEPRFRFWLGLRLIFRWVTHALVFFETPPQSLFGTAVVVIVLEFLQLSLRPFKGFWRNLSDGLFLLNLVILFVGSLYFRALDSDNDDTERYMEQATAFSTVFIALAYVGYVAILSYHIIVRFPKLQQALKRNWQLMVRRVRRQKEEDELDVPELRKESVVPHSSETPVSSVTFTELREPLLDGEGSLTIVTLPSRPRPEVEYVETRNTT